MLKAWKHEDDLITHGPRSSFGVGFRNWRAGLFSGRSDSDNRLSGLAVFVDGSIANSAEQRRNSGECARARLQSASTVCRLEKSAVRR